MVTTSQDLTGTAGTFSSLDPATGEVVGEHPLMGGDMVAAAVGAARAAQAGWDRLGFAGRRARLLAWKHVLVARAQELARLVHRENGKPIDDALLEIMLAVEHLDWAARRAGRVLGSRRVPAGPLMANQAASLAYVPLGVVGVIGPWNYPVFTPMGSIAYALAAGNAVVFKPSEFTPGIAAWLADSFASAVGDSAVFTVVTGDGGTGEALCRSGVDKLAFTGSARTARRVMAACADTLTPVLLECGGKDALIVAEDADVDAAARAALWGGMANAGQTCVGVERVYVADAVHDAFLARLVALAAGVRPGTDDRASYGPITMPAQVEVIRRHIADALARGARAVVGGPDAIHGPYVDPVVLTGVPDDALALREETFGPTLTVTRVRDGADGVDRANDSPYGLASAVFSRRHGMALARRLRAGMTSVNAVIAFAAVPSLPFGGVGESGFGRIHGADGLREFSRAQAITRQRFASPLELTSFSRSPRTMAIATRILRLRHGGRRP